MAEIHSLVDGLKNRDDQQAYQCLKQLEEASVRSAAVYPFFDTFVQMLDSTNSYFCIRALVLIAANARWDVDCKVDQILNSYLKYITDDKPITARQCIKMLPCIAAYKPNLKCVIENALHNADVSGYKGSMQTLIIKDIQAALLAIRIL